MSLYREAGRRGMAPLAAALIAGLLVGGAIGFVLGGSGEDEPSLSEQLASLRDQLRPAISGLDVVPIEYDEGVEDGAIVAEPEYQASIDATNRAIEIVAGIREDLNALDSDSAERAVGALVRLRRLIEHRAPPPGVESQAQVAQRLIGLLAAGR